MKKISFIMIVMAVMSLNVVGCVTTNPLNAGGISNLSQPVVDVYVLVDNQNQPVLNQNGQYITTNKADGIWENAIGESVTDLAKGLILTDGNLGRSVASAGVELVSQLFRAPKSKQKPAKYPAEQAGYWWLRKDLVPKKTAPATPSAPQY